MLISGRNQQQERRYQNVRITRIARRYNQPIAREINRAMNEIANNLSDPLAGDRIRHKHSESMTKILTSLWTESGKLSVSGMFTIAKHFLQMELKRDITTPIVDQAVADWILVEGRTQIISITDTTLDTTLKIIADARIEGLGEREIGRLIHEIAPSLSASRAQTIARTEAHGSSQGISLNVASKTEIPMKKIWLSDRSGTARGAHLDIDGQERSLSQDFDVDDEQLRYPGDSSGSAGNVINCKCVIGYDVA
jgi:hypothetical protein